jgi:phage-related protein (TIGR01555 family)
MISSHNSPQKARQIADSWSNLATGIGLASSDPTLNNSFVALSAEQDWSEMARSGLSRRIVCELPNQCLREGFQLYCEKPEQTEAILAYLENIKFNSILNDALILARTLGGCGIIPFFEDSRALSEPIDWSIESGKILGFKAFSSKELKVTDVKQDLQYFDDPAKYQLKLVTGGSKQSIDLPVDASRVFPIYGDPVPRDKQFSTYNGWGASILFGLWKEISAFEMGMQAIDMLLVGSSVPVLGIKGLQTLLATDEDGSASSLLKARIQALLMGRSIAKAWILDRDGESLTRDTVSLGQIPEILDRKMAYICSVTGYPRSILFGDAPSGLGNSASTDLRKYYATVKSEQRLKLDHIINPVINCVNRQLFGSGAAPVSFTWNEINPLSETEESVIRQNQANTDSIYLQNGVLLPEEVRNSRFAGEYSTETSIDPSADFSAALPQNNQDFQG